MLTDIRMPGEMDGFALTRWIKENRPGVRVVIQSGESVAMPEDLAEFGPILPKPYTGRDLLNRVKFELSKVSAAMIPPSGGGFRRQ